jgi:hypothetical protein
MTLQRHSLQERNNQLSDAVRRILACLVLCLSAAVSQEQADSLAQWNFEPVLECGLVRYLAPENVRTAAVLQDYVRDTMFLHLRMKFGDAAAIDAIYRQALYLTEDDQGEALLIAAGGVLEHFRLGIRIPIFGVLTLPLTLESVDQFRMRYRNLPSRVFSDSADTVSNDKDKLQHFFGSAYLAFTEGWDKIAEHIGDWIERGEESFIVGGRDDVRDRKANALGREFGLLLLDDAFAVPSDVLCRRTVMKEKNLPR